MACCVRTYLRTCIPSAHSFHVDRIRVFEDGAEKKNKANCEFIRGAYQTYTKRGGRFISSTFEEEKSLLFSLACDTQKMNGVFFSFHFSFIFRKRINNGCIHICQKQFTTFNKRRAGNIDVCSDKDEAYNFVMMLN